MSDAAGAYLRPHYGAMRSQVKKERLQLKCERIDRSVDRLMSRAYESAGVTTLRMLQASKLEIPPLYILVKFERWPTKPYIRIHASNQKPRNTNRN